MSVMGRRGHAYRTILLLAALCGGRAAAAGPVEDELAVAAGHYQARRWDLAAESFATFERRFPDHPFADEARFYHAEALAQVGHFQQAALILDDLIRSGRAGDNRRRAMFRRGEAAYLARDFENAAEYLHAFWQDFPEDELLRDVLGYLGDVHTALGDHAEAERAYRARLERSPEEPPDERCRRGLARALVAQGEFEEAEQILVELAKSDQSSIALPARLELAHLALRRRDFLAVKQHCSSLLAGTTQNEPAVRLLLAEALHELNDVSAADEQYQHVYESAAPESLRERALYGRLRLAVERGDHTELERLSDEFLRAFGSSAKAANVHAALGAARALRGEHGEAAESFRVALAIDAGEEVAARCLDGLAVALAASGEFEEARTNLSLLQSRYGQHWDVASTGYEIAQLAYTAGVRDVAAELFAEVANAGSSPELAAKAMAGLAWARLRQEDLAGSAEAFEKLIASYPHDPRAAEAGLMRAQILERRQDYDAALATYHRVIDRLAGEQVLPQALYLAARLHDRLGQATEARALYERLIASYPSHDQVPSSLYHLGWLLREKGEPRAAHEAWQSLHSRGSGTPHWREATYLLAETALERQDPQRSQRLVDELIEAIEAEHSTLEQASDHDGGGLYARSLLLAAQLAMDRDEWEAARDYCERIVARCPTDPLQLQARFWVAEAEYRLQRFTTAYERFDELESAVAGRNEGDDPWIPFVPLRRAQILAHQKQWPEAKRAAERVLERHADFALRYEANYVVGRSLAAIGEFEAAREAYQRVLDSEAGGKSETAAMAQWMIGETHMHQQDYDAALKAYLRGEILFPYPQWQAHSLLQAGKCYELLGDWKQAHATYRRLSDRFPDSDLNDQARARLHLVSRKMEVSK